MSNFNFQNFENFYGFSEELLEKEIKSVVRKLAEEVKESGSETFECELLAEDHSKLLENFRALVDASFEKNWPEILTKIGYSFDPLNIAEYYASSEKLSQKMVEVEKEILVVKEELIKYEHQVKKDDWKKIVKEIVKKNFEDLDEQIAAATEKLEKLENEDL